MLSEQLDQPVAKREKCRFEDSECKLHRPSDPRGADARVLHGLHTWIRERRCVFGWLKTVQRAMCASFGSDRALLSHPPFDLKATAGVP